MNATCGIATLLTYPLAHIKCEPAKNEPVSAARMT